MKKLLVAFSFVVAGCGQTVPHGVSANEDGGAEECSGGLVTLAGNQNDPFGVIVDATSVYWTADRETSVVKMAKCGGAITTLASRENQPYGLAIDTTDLYWTVGDSVVK